MIQTTEEYKTLLKQRAAIDEKLVSARKNIVAVVLKDIKTLIEDTNLTYEDILPILPKPKRKAQKRYAPKYKNPETGETWAGRGKMPNWLMGKNKKDFEI